MSSRPCKPLRCDSRKAIFLSQSENFSVGVYRQPEAAYKTCTLLFYWFYQLTLNSRHVRDIPSDLTDYGRTEYILALRH